MAKQRSEKSKFLSRYSGDTYVSTAQYVTELICERKAAQNNKELPVRFWKLDEWAAYFKSQIFTAHKLCKKYRAAAIIKALMNPKNYKTYSLRAPFLEKSIIEEHNAIIVAEQQAEKNRQEREGRNVDIKVGISERKEFKKRNRVNSLMELDNGQEENKE